MSSQRTIPCATCERSFTPRNSRSRYCSAKCRDKSYGLKIKRPVTHCKVCESPTGRKDKAYCSPACSQKDLGGKWCSGCKAVKPLEAFNRSSASKDNHHFRCSECSSRGTMHRKKAALASPETAAPYLASVKLHRAKYRAFQHKIRQEMFDAYGRACSCCGESIEEFLTLEHTRGDGGEHRKQFPSTTAVLKDLKNRGWPRDGYTVLCMNCNWGSRWTGTCPHKQNASPS